MTPFGRDLLLDTHAWLWLIVSPGHLSAVAARAIAAARTITIASISPYEIALKHSTGKLHLDLEIDAWMAMAMSYPGIRIAELTPAIAIRAAALRSTVGRDPADGIIAATALETGVQLVTKDGRLRSALPGTALW